MSDSGFSEELEKFIQSQFETLEQLEVLLLLARVPEKIWEARAVYEVIKSSLPSVEQRLKELVSQGYLVEVQGNALAYQYAPTSEEASRLVTELVRAYKERPVKVVQAIYSRPPKAKEMDPLEEFAKAFRFRKEK
ncbi:MAG: hypothetical protein SFY81_10040 [Verrucomicrobiota bacterium]|nr:hypothetical protein [Verrucomicrobiota bacterium]